MSDTAKKIGFIGIGLMGHGMAKNILQGGYPLTVMGHRNRAPVDDLVGRGASEAATPADVARASDIVFLCVTGSVQVEAIVRGADGLKAGAHEGLIIVDCSTSQPTSTQALAAELGELGVRFVDAPLSRTPKEAEAGTLDTMIGADKATLAEILPVVGCWAGNIIHVGDVGAGHTMKLINNFVALGYGALYSEALALGQKAGIAPEKFHEVIGAGRLTNGFYETFMKYVVGGDRDAHKFSIANAHKDMRYLADLASATGGINLISSMVRNYYAGAEAAGRGGDYVPMLSDYVRELNGIGRDD
ncbi:NAD(P)-dependent oxidoreductase [Breoghania sp. L-A4]|uniref:NAD(P)-dependent oxidoreductase n=1 Tax=Breoghania sp. L-A4 TaxID=2304600 RepID=UPI000E3608CE|nr:NAD(P)-dependent oxidoreductase [Breoghania sp. L-A4]AXS41918.1 NAD(P)-dependent oxidoreductase [Breoghania sp. L-A4]